MKRTFYSNGKLLLTAEYLVLDGATALAIPTCYGQSLEVVPSNNDGIECISLDCKGEIWYSGKFKILNNNINALDQDARTKKLQEVFQQAKRMNPNFLTETSGWTITSKLDFPLDWGLGTSSTLINNIAQWAEVDPYILLSNSFGGSGYDIAAACNSGPILYNLQHGDPIVKTVDLHWEFIDQLFFVHLNRKQNSREGIAHYQDSKATLEQLALVSAISHSMLRCESLDGFKSMLQKHEDIVSEILRIPTIKEQLFKDYPNVIKSLGAWGGDFILAIGNEEEQDYFKSKGYKTVITFNDMIL